MENIQLTIPDGWHEVTIGMFQEMSQLDQAEDGLLKIIDLLSILTDTDPEELKEIDASHLKVLIDKIDWTSKFPESEYKTEFTIKDQTYYLVTLSDLSLGEWIDLDSYCEDPVENMAKIFALLYRPHGEKYDVKKAEQRASIFLQHLMISDVYGSLLFFSLIGKEFIKISAGSLLSQISLN